MDHQDHPAPKSDPDSAGERPVTTPLPDPTLPGRQRWAVVAVLALLVLLTVGGIAYAWGRDADDHGDRPPHGRLMPDDPQERRRFTDVDTAEAFAALRDARKVLDRAFVHGEVRTDVCVDLNNMLDHVHELVVTGRAVDADTELANLRTRVADRRTEDAITPRAAQRLDKSIDDLEDALDD